MAWDTALVLEQGLTALFSAFNTFHFLGYRSPRRGRRWGALALALVNLAFLIQSLYLGILPALLGLVSAEVLLNTRLRLAAGVFPLASSLLISAFILRWRLRRRNR